MFVISKVAGEGNAIGRILVSFVFFYDSMRIRSGWRLTCNWIWLRIRFRARIAMQHGVPGTGAGSIYSIHSIHSSRRASSPLGPHPLNRTRRIPPLQCVSSHSAWNRAVRSPVLPCPRFGHGAAVAKYAYDTDGGLARAQEAIRAAGMRLRGRLRVAVLGSPLRDA